MRRAAMHPDLGKRAWLRLLLLLLACLWAAASPAWADEGREITRVLGRHYYAAQMENLEEYLATLDLEPGQEADAAALAQGLWAKIGVGDVKLGRVEISLSPDGNMALARYGVSGLIRDKESGDSFRKQTTYVAILAKRGGWKIKRVMPEVIFRGQLKEESLQRQSWRMLALADGKAAPRGEALASQAGAAPTSRNAPAAPAATSAGRASAGFSEQVIPPSPANAPKPDDQERMRAAQAFREGTEAFNAQLYDKAIRKFEAYLAVNPNDQMGRRRLAMARRMKSGMGFGSLEVSCQPTAQVFLDGKPAGTTPLSLDRVPVGPRRLEVRTAQASQSREVNTKPRTLSMVKFYLGDARPAARTSDDKAGKKPAPAAGQATPARGFILEVNGEEATIDLGSNQGVKPGDRFKVLRMKTFIHPVSGKKFFWKRRAGLIEVTQVQEDLSLAVVVSSRGELEPGLPIVRSQAPDSPDSPAGPEALQE